jgi:type II secretory ATPase GspE/PulE/Tfp pilus assembly ATPase PilB-like protein
MPSAPIPKASSIEDLIKSKAKPDAPAPGSNLSLSGPPKATKKTTVTAESSAPEQFAETLSNIKLREKEGLAKQRAVSLGLEHIILRGFPIAPEALSLLQRERAEEVKAVIFLRVKDQVRVGAIDKTPAVDALVKEIEGREHANVQVYIISEDSFNAAYKLYDALPEVKEVIYGYRIEEADIAKFEKEIGNIEELRKRIQDVNTTDVLTLIVGASLRLNASDIHVEAEETKVKFRFRIDGLLRDAADLPRESWKQVITRLKLLAGVKLNIENTPQDGRITVYLSNEKIDIRVSFLPTAFGESVVMRLLRPKAIALEFDNLGVRGRALEHLEEQILKPNGMIITTGPAGSGKTTTLYAILKKLNSPEVKIITLEDPVEYKLEGINQSQIDHTKKYDFAAGLRSILRQDPDVVMVGEIRDLETADIAIQASLTGHLVVSTIHTNSAAGAIPRFLSMGVKPFLLSPSLNAVIGQRLVRRLCTKCKVPADLTLSQRKQVMSILKAISPAAKVEVNLEALTFSAPGSDKACDVCSGFGYKGRVGIYEIFTITPRVEEMILKGTSTESDIEAEAVKDGMITMAQDGLLKALDGLTSVDEVLAVANTDTMVENEQETITVEAAQK